LSAGNHDFVFDIDKKFFDDFEGSEIKEGKVNVLVNLTKTANFLELNFRLEGTLLATCDRCLDEFELPIEYLTKLYVKFGDITDDQNDEIIMLPYSEGELDIKQFIYEYIHLSLPYKRVHPNDKKGKSTCNTEMLKKLGEYTVKEHTETPWDDLKKLMNKN
jgi:uncharacterized metal-binding protein YceD (DUF177 family)